MTSLASTLSRQVPPQAIARSVAAAANPADRRDAGNPDHLGGNASSWREYAEVIGVMTAITLGAWYAPLDHHVLGHIYLLAVILLCLRVGRGPVLFAAVVSAIGWNYFFIPPRFSFQLLDYDDAMLLGIYFTVALIAGQLTARIRESEREERRRERHATALFHLTRALAGAQSLDEAVGLALRQADGLFHANTALLLRGMDEEITVHWASSFIPDEHECAAAMRSWGSPRPASSPGGDVLHLPLMRAGRVLGGFMVRACRPGVPPVAGQHELREAFAAQIALLVEREQLRAASEREKLLAESERLHRTLLDSVSHELKTPLAVLHTAGEKLDTNDAGKRTALVAELRTATSRLDHLVANLLNQTRLESGTLRPDLDWCDLRDIINASRRGAGKALDGHPLKMELPVDLPWCKVDAPLIEQVVTNLLLNAAVHTPPGTAITLTAGREKGASPGRLFLRVADRGPGLSADLRGRLFQKFQRGPGARACGLGLGLSIVRGFMLAHGGEVVASDNPGGGACFTIYLACAATRTHPR